MRFRNCILFSALALSAWGCPGQPPEAPQTDPAEVRRAIEHMNEQFAQAFNGKDFAAVAGFYTEDAILMPPNAEMAQGREAIQKALQTQIGPMENVNLSLSTLEVEVVENTAYEAGVYQLTLTLPEGQGQVDDRGKYVVIWKQRPDGNWALHWDIWNSSRIQPGGEEQ